MPDRIYLDDCERFNGTNYFPYHYFDRQWTWMPRTAEAWYCYSPKFDTDEVQGSASIKIESDIYRVASGFWPSELQGWVLDGAIWDIAGHLQGTEPNGTGTLVFLDTVPNNRDLEGKPGLVWNTCAFGDGDGANNNFYMISDNGTKIGIHNRNEYKYLNPNRYYSSITVNDVVQDSWYQAGGDSPGSSWSYLNRVGNTYSYIIKHGPDETLATISATVSLPEIKELKYVGSSIAYGLYHTIAIGQWWNYSKSYGTSYIYKNVYAAGVDQKNFRYCDTLWYSIKANLKEPVNSYVKFVIGDSNYDQWEYDITINVNNTWEQKSIDITNLPLYVRQNGIRYVGFKYVHDILETEYSDFIFRYDNIHADPSEEYTISEDYAFIT